MGRDDARLGAAALERERRALHHVLRVADAAAAEDAGIGVVAHQLVAVGVRLAAGVREDERRLDAEVEREVEELVGAAAARGRDVLGQQHLGQRPLQLRQAAVRRDRHPLLDADRARGHRARRALDVDEAHPAAAVGLELVVVAERRRVRAVLAERVQEQLAALGDGLAPVHGEPDLAHGSSSGPVAADRAYRDRRSLAEPADRRLLERLEPGLQLLARERGAAGGEVVEPARADPARRALLARLLGEEPHRLGEQLERRVRGREDLHRRRADRGAPLRERLPRHGRVERGRRQDPARGAAGDDRADLLRRAAAVLVDQLAQRDPVSAPRSSRASRQRRRETRAGRPSRRSGRARRTTRRLAGGSRGCARGSRRCRSASARRGSRAARGTAGAAAASRAGPPSTPASRSPRRRCTSRRRRRARSCGRRGRRAPRSPPAAEPARSRTPRAGRCTRARPRRTPSRRAAPRASGSGGAP